MKFAPLLRRLTVGLPLIASACVSRAAISYTVIGSTYSEDFNSLPTDAPNNATLEATPTPYVSEGWTDDTTSVAGVRVSVPGWHLFHPESPASENGFNGNQRFRMGSGSNTGSFWGFSSPDASNADKALGNVGSNTVALSGENLYFAERLVNDSQVTLNSFTLTFDGEQWRDGQSPGAETMSFSYSATATLANWNSPAGPFTVVPALDFTSPVFAGVVTTGTALNGNLAANRIADISATISGISWAPGADLWLRWADPNVATFADDGLAIDNVRFSAFDPIPEPSGVALLGLSATGLLGIRRRGR